mmetsp:Transcript_60497/g.91240  ORF Transcript_60497/g.91240 Transcript_60497/m.91240 type:complete len:303 (+) Transcript_60497:2-910(+)
MYLVKHLDGHHRFDALDLPLLDNVERVALLVLAADDRAVSVLLRLHRLGDTEPLVLGDGLQDLHVLQELLTLALLGLCRRHEDATEGFLAKGPAFHILDGLDSCGTTIAVQQSQLTERAPGTIVENLDGGVVALLHPHLGLARAQEIPVITLVTLGDDLVPRLERTALHGVDDNLSSIVVQVVEHDVLSDVTLDDLALFGGLLEHRSLPGRVGVERLDKHVGTAGPSTLRHRGGLGFRGVSLGLGLGLLLLLFLLLGFGFRRRTTSILTFRDRQPKHVVLVNVALEHVHKRAAEAGEGGAVE